MNLHYVLIASRDPFENESARRGYELAASLTQEGHQVTLFLVQNGVLPARRCQASRELETLAEGGVRVLADELSLGERGIAPERIAAGIEPASPAVVIEALEAGARTLWV